MRRSVQPPKRVARPPIALGGKIAHVPHESALARMRHDGMARSCRLSRQDRKTFDRVPSPSQISRELGERDFSRSPIDSFSHCPHINTRLVHISRVVGSAATEPISSRNCEHFLEGLISSIASTRLRRWGGSAARESRAVWIGERLHSGRALQQCGQLTLPAKSTHSSENAHRQLWFLSFVRHTERLHLPVPRSEPCRMAERPT